MPLSRSRYSSALLSFTFLMSFSTPALGSADKPPLTLDEFFNSVHVREIEISPDGESVVIETERADWDASIFRHDLWLYRAAGPGSPSSPESLVMLTRSGHDHDGQWSPDGRWIAFLSDRTGEVNPGAEAEGGGKTKEVSQLYRISPQGGEPLKLTSGDEDVHAFAWSADSKRIYFATRVPWSKQHKDDYKKEWHDVIRYRESLRGDLIESAGIPGASAEAPGQVAPLAGIDHRVKQMAASPDGKWLAFISEPRSQRQESTTPYSVYLASLPDGKVEVLSHSEAVYDRIAWSRDSQGVFFSFLNGSAEGPYQDAQTRVYSVDLAGNHAVHRWGQHFAGALTDFAVAEGGSLLAAGMLGTQIQPYAQPNPAADLIKQPGWPGSYGQISTAAHSGRVAFVYSSLERPEEVYLADSNQDFEHARPVTRFNQLLTERALPQGRPYRWTADDGTPVEGMLIYPPGQFGAAHLPMFTLIHGGPGDADGDHFEADWYQWSVLAATRGWLVFEPNYRGSIGYGDAFTLGIIPHIVSRPGKDILEGVEALVKDGIADPGRLTVGGYSYGGYMTNWLITQTTRFKAAVTGAGAVEHVANWGNDDTTYDDAYFLGGRPWEAERNYNAEAAIWQIAKVKTPTHLVAGAEDIRVYVGEDYLLERALHALGIPSSLLVFPGEGHSLSKNPWHGKIKVREELEWLDKYGFGRDRAHD